MTRTLQGSRSDASQVKGLTEPYDPAVIDQFLQKEVARADLLGRGFSLPVARIDDFDNFPRGGLTSRASRLGTFAKILKQKARTVDIIGRTGEAEFAVLLPETEPKDAKVLWQSIASELKSNFTISVGVVSYPRDASDSESLLEVARSGWEMGS